MLHSGRLTPALRAQLLMHWACAQNLLVANANTYTLASVSN